MTERLRNARQMLWLRQSDAVRLGGVSWQMSAELLGVLQNERQRSGDLYK